MLEGKRDMRTLAIALAATLSAGSVHADEQVIKLKQGSGVETVQNSCAACHTLAYIPMNSVYLNAAGWNAEVAKMRKAFGAPIDDADAKIIADYLAKNYGS
jgi:sulfite dehydrogenase (cytochrome) subunit B